MSAFPFAATWLQLPLRLPADSSMAWAEQALASADLSDRFPQAVDWINVTGCRASDLNEEYINELASFLKLKPIPYKRLCKIC